MQEHYAEANVYNENNLSYEIESNEGYDAACVEGKQLISNFI